MKIWAKTKEFCEGKFLVVRRDGSVPHWPHFVLGARDKYAPGALRHYAKIVRIDGGDEEYAASIEELAHDFEQYRREQGDGDPFAPPHRKDNPRVLEAMRGGPSAIVVNPDRRNAPKSQ